MVGRAAAAPAAVRQLLEGLPDWFGEPSAIEEYVADAARMPNYFARAGEDVIGVLLLRRHFAESAEIQLIAVDRAWHRRGVGRALVTAVQADLTSTAGSATQLLQVKTIGPSLDDPFYAETRKFYLSLSFLPLEELLGAQSPTTPWPCLVLVKPLSTHTRPFDGQPPENQPVEPPAT